MGQAKSYDWSQFTVKIDLKASSSKVFQAWTDERKIVKWFVEKANIEPKKNGRLYLEWLTGDKSDDKIIAIRKDSLFHFPFGAGGEEVKVKIRKITGGSVCEIHQFNMKTGPMDKVNWHMGCRAGWTFFLTNLKAYLEHGLDLRSRNPKMSYKQGYVNS